MRKLSFVVLMAAVAFVSVSGAAGKSYPQDEQTYQIYSYPVHIAGTTYEAEVDSDGRLQVDIGESIAITGITIEVNLGELAEPVAAEGAAATKGTQISGDDGTTSKFIQVDSSGNLKVVGTGSAGTPAGGVLSIQGIGSGTAVPVSGTFWQTTQPVSVATIPSHAVTNAGTFAVQATQSGTWNVNADGATVEAISSTLSTLDGKVTACNTGAIAGTVSVSGAVTVDCNSSNVTIDNASIPVTGTFWQATQPVSLASVPSHDVTNAGTFAVQAAQSGTWTVNADGATIEAISSSVSSLDGKVTACNTGAVTVSALPNVTVDTFPDNEPFDMAQYGGSTVGASNAVHVQPGSGATFPVSGTFWQATQPVSLASVPSHEVTNAGTFATQSNLMTSWGTTYNLALTLANTEYSQALTNIHRIQFRCRSAVDVRFSDTTGKVAGSVSPFETLPANGVYYERDLNIASATLYFATASTGVTMEIHVW